MAKAAYQHALARQIGDLGAQIGAAEAKLKSGSDREKVAAASELAELRDRYDALRAKLPKFEKGEESGWEDVKSGLANEIGNLAAAFQRWADRH